MKKVFLIDDDPVFVFLARGIFTKIDPSLEISTFADGELATEALQERKHVPDRLPDLIFLDLNMPVMDGWQFLDEYGSFQNNIDKYIPVYVVSSTISVEDIDRCRRHTFVTEFLQKPINEHQLKMILLRA